MAWRKVALWLILVVAAGFSGPAAGGNSADDGPVYAVGNFLIQWNPLTRRLTITGADHTVWASRPGAAFIHAGVAQLDVTENRGSFLIDEDIQALCDEQTVEEITPGPGRLTLSGHISGGWNAPCATDYTLVFTPPLPDQLAFEVQFATPAVNYVELSYSADADESFYGFGEQFSYVDLKGQSVPILSQEGGIGRGHPIITPIIELGSRGSGGTPFTTYDAVPFYLTNHNRALFLNNSEYSVFDLTTSEQVTVRLFAPVMRGRILAGTSMPDLVTIFTAYAGRMPALPAWFNAGVIAGLQGGSQKVLQIFTELRYRRAPVAAVWLQDWIGRRETRAGSQLWWNWEVDTDLYPDWDAMRAEIEAYGARILCYINPYLVDVANERPRPPRHDLYREAVENGYVVLNQAGEPYLITNTTFDAVIIDLTNPDAVAWFKQVIKDQVLGEAGCRGWMHDYGEGLPFDAVLHSGVPASVYHNQFPVDWARLAHDVVAEEGLEDEVVVFNRSGFTRTPAYSRLLWEGDQLVTWDAYDGMQSALIGLLSGGFSGLALNHSDIGGYTNVTIEGLGYNRSQELLLRWMEMSAFTAAFRTHEGLQPENNAQFYDNETTYTAFTRMAKVYAALAFYREALYEESATYGWPLVRHLVWQFPDDATAAGLNDEFMLGSELLVAPIMDELASLRASRDVYFPAEGPMTWVNVWTCQQITLRNGGWETVAAPLGQPPVFYRLGSEVGDTFARHLAAAGLLPHACLTPQTYLPVVRN